MKIQLDDTEAVALLSILNERKAKYNKLSGLAEGRIKNERFSKNAEKLMNKHKSKVETAQGLVNKIANQL